MVARHIRHHQFPCLNEPSDRSGSPAGSIFVGPRKRIWILVVKYNLLHGSTALIWQESTSLEDRVFPLITRPGSGMNFHWDGIFIDWPLVLRFSSTSSILNTHALTVSREPRDEDRSYLMQKQYVCSLPVATLKLWAIDWYPRYSGKGENLLQDFNKDMT